MINNSKKIIILSIFIFVLSFLINHKASASVILLKPSSTTLGIGEQFYVDVLLDTEGKTINGIEGSINFSSENISFVRAEEGGSMINLWVDKPTSNGSTIHFSGIMPNGFYGVIDPFNPSVKLPGLMIRLIFEAKKEGNPTISSSGFYTTLNDGLGTVDNIEPSSTTLSVSNISNPYIYKTKNDITPEITAYVTRDPNIFNNKYVLIFEAKDRKTGIKEVSIKEGKREWKKIESPYLLEDQTRHSIITLQATNYEGTSIVVGISTLPYKLFSFHNIFIAIVILFVLFFIFKIIYERYKNIHN